MPIFHRQYRQAEIHNTEVLGQTQNLLDDNLIEDSDSPYNSSVFVVPKKPDPDGNKGWRMVIDFRKLNEKTIKDAYPLPNITHILDQLGGASYFSTLDLAMRFHQIKMYPNSKAKTAFSTLYGHYHYNRLPFGLKNAPATFQRLMDKVLSGLQGIELFVYMDDIVIYADSLEEHTRKLRTLFKRLERANLTLQPEKCSFLRKEVGYLGHIISRDGVKPDPLKVEAVRKFSQPKNAKNIKQFLGLAGYYRRFIPDLSVIAKPLTFLLKKNVTFRWTKTQHESFNKLKDILCAHRLLQYPDFSRPFIVSCDASNYGIRGVLSQNFDGKVLPIAYISRTLSETEINYATIEKELLAILYSVETFRPYLYGRQFTLETDHRPLVWLHNVKNANSKLVRWRYLLNDYDYEIVYKKGIINLNADALSRNPCDAGDTDQCENTTLNIDLDPLEDTPIPTHKVLISLNRTPVPSHITLEDTQNINRIEKAFLKTNTDSIGGGAEFIKGLSCQYLKDKTNEPDFNDDEIHETAHEYSGDEDINSSSGPTGPSVVRRSLENASRTAQLTSGDEAEIDFRMSNGDCLNRQVVGRSLENASRTAQLTPVSGEDCDESGGLVLEIGPICNNRNKSCDSSLDFENSFEFVNSLQKCPSKNYIMNNLNRPKIRMQKSYPLPVSH